jgi:hypothetical protein
MSMLSTDKEGITMQGMNSISNNELYLVHVNSLKYWTNGSTVIVGLHAAVQGVISAGERWVFPADDTQWLGDFKYCNTVLDLSAKFGDITEEGEISMFINKKMSRIRKSESFASKASFIEAVISQKVKGATAVTSSTCLKVKPQKDGSHFYPKGDRAIFYLNAVSTAVQAAEMPSRAELDSMPLNLLSAEDFITKFFL